MTTTFKWFCSYFDTVEYKVFGSTPVRSLEIHHGSEDCLNYMKSIHNYNGDPTSFDREVVSAQGGASIHYSEGQGLPYHWTPELYDAFVSYLRARHEDSQRQTGDMYDRYGVPQEARHFETLFIPRPIFFNFDTRLYETEPWFRELSVASPVADTAQFC